jgi:DHA1 family tetracycline resistance protein-like MFS transporter
MGGLLGAIDLRLPFYAAGTLALVNLLYGVLVLPESLPADRRRPFEWRRANPVVALKALAELKGIGPLVAVIALTGLAQFTMHTTWVLYTAFKFGWGPLQNGWSLFTVGLMSALVQGVLMRHLLVRFSARRLASLGMVSFAVCYALWGLAGEGWMMYPIIVANLFGFAASAAMQSIVSNAADAHVQGQTLGAVSSINSLMAVLAPLVGAPLLAVVSHLPPGDWRIGLPYYVCAVLQGAAAAIAIWHFSRHRTSSIAAPAA